MCSCWKIRVVGFKLPIGSPFLFKNISPRKLIQIYHARRLYPWVQTSFKPQVVFTPCPSSRPRPAPLPNAIGNDKYINSEEFASNYPDHADILSCPRHASVVQWS